MKRGALFVPRRRLLAAGAGLGAAGLLPAARASGPTRILVGFPPGQATDIVARLLADRMRSGDDTYIVENRPGQGGSIALGQLAAAPNDGSVMMLGHMSALCTNPAMYKSVPYNTLKDFDVVGLLGDLPFVLVCNPSLPFQSVQDLVVYCKANPDKLTNASSGNGTVSHLAMEAFKRRAGVRIVHVPYKGSAQGLTDVVAGNVSIALETAAGVKPFVESGQLRALAAGTQQRLPGVLGVPTMNEQGFPGFNAVTWLMLLYRAGTSPDLIQATFNRMNTVMKVSEVEQRLIQVGCLPRFSASPQDASSYLASEFSRWGEIVRQSGVRLD